MRIILVLALGTAFVVSSACVERGGAQHGANASSGRLEVVASLFPIAEVLRVVGGDAVVVTDLMPPGVEPHDFELKPSDVEKVHDADVVVVIGGGFQPAVEKAASRGDARVLTLLPAGEQDPHLWLDPTAMQIIAGQVASSFGELRPKAADGFARRAKAFRDRLGDLDSAFRAGLATCRIRTLVTAHGAFGHLARRYDLEQVGVAGIDPSAEPSPARIDELAELVNNRGVTTVFTETLVSPRVAKALAREAGVRTAVLDPIEGVGADEVKSRLGYLDLMRRNLAVLRAALACP